MAARREDFVGAPWEAVAAANSINSRPIPFSVTRLIPPSCRPWRALMVHDAQRSNDVAIIKCSKMMATLSPRRFQVLRDALFNDEHFVSRAYTRHKRVCGSISTIVLNSISCARIPLALVGLHTAAAHFGAWKQLVEALSLCDVAETDVVVMDQPVS